MLKKPAWAIEKLGRLDVSLHSAPATSARKGIKANKGVQGLQTLWAAHRTLSPQLEVAWSLCYERALASIVLLFAQRCYWGKDQGRASAVSSNPSKHLHSQPTTFKTTKIPQRIACAACTDSNDIAWHCCSTAHVVAMCRGCQSINSAIQILDSSCRAIPLKNWRVYVRVWLCKLPSPGIRSWPRAFWSLWRNV